MPASCGLRGEPLWVKLVRIGKYFLIKVEGHYWDVHLRSFRNGEICARECVLLFWRVGEDIYMKRNLHETTVEKVCTV